MTSKPKRRKEKAMKPNPTYPVGFRWLEGLQKPVPDEPLRPIKTMMRTLLVIPLLLSCTAFGEDLHLAKGGMLSGELGRVTTESVEIVTTIGRTWVSPADLTAETRARLGIGTAADNAVAAEQKRIAEDKASFERRMRIALLEARVEAQDRADVDRRAREAANAQKAAANEARRQSEALEALERELIIRNLQEQARYGPVWISRELAEKLKR